MTYDQAVQVVKLAMRESVPALVQTHEDYDDEFTVTLFTDRYGTKFTAFTAALDATDRVAGRR